MALRSWKRPSSSPAEVGWCRRGFPTPSAFLTEIAFLRDRLPQRRRGKQAAWWVPLGSRETGSARMATGQALPQRQARRRFARAAIMTYACRAEGAQRPGKLAVEVKDDVPTVRNGPRPLGDLVGP